MNSDSAKHFSWGKVHTRSLLNFYKSYCWNRWIVTARLSQILRIIITVWPPIELLDRGSVNNRFPSLKVWLEECNFSTNNCIAAYFGTFLYFWHDDELWENSAESGHMSANSCFLKLSFTLCIVAFETLFLERFNCNSLICSRRAIVHLNLTDLSSISFL